MEDLLSKVGAIEKKIAYTFENKELLLTAFTHRSYFNEHKDIVSENNERLEFLGDAVLGVVISDYLFSEYPSTPEGELSSMRSRLVDAIACASYVKELGLESFVLLGKGEQMNAGKGRDSILADLFEGIVGAIYKDGGFSAASTFILDHFAENFYLKMGSSQTNYKAELQDWAQKKYHQPPVYEVLAESGPDHSKVFEVEVYAQDEKLGLGKGASKKEAQQEAAKNALKEIENGETEESV